MTYHCPRITMYRVTDYLAGVHVETGVEEGAITQRGVSMAVYQLPWEECNRVIMAS